MEKNTVLSPKDVLASIYDAEPADLQLAITLNPDVERIVQAMKSYAQQFQSPAPLSAEELWEKHSSDHRMSFQEFYNALQEASQRQPVAPEREGYWKKRCVLAERFISETPCCPDVCQEQLEAYSEWQDFIASPSAENKGGEG